MRYKALFTGILAGFALLTAIPAAAAETTANSETTVTEMTETTTFSETTADTETTASADTSVSTETTAVTADTTDTADSAATTEAATETTETTTTTEPIHIESGTNADGRPCFYGNGEVMTGVFAVVPEELVGDANDDAAVDAMDAVLLLQAAAEEGAGMQTAAQFLLVQSGLPAEADVFLRCDVSGNNCINAQDAAEILSYCARSGASLSVQPLGLSMYFADETGVPQTGWLTDENGARYYAHPSGKLQLQWGEFEDGRRYFGENGVLCTGWTEITDRTYYFDAEGRMLTGLQTIDGKICRFKSSGVLQDLKICLDAGHFAKYNQSPVNKNYWESEMTWKLHLYLKEELEQYGITVITTREEQEVDLGLADRGHCAAGCDLFLSIHSNADDSASVDKPMAFCTVTGKVDALGQLLADTTAEVMETRQPGEIAHKVGSKGDWYSVLYGAYKVGVPGILMEHSFHTNLRATNWLLEDENLQKLAAAEAKVISDYYLK